MVLRHQITFEAESRVSDGQGGGTSTWTTAAVEWGNVIEKSMSRTLDQSGIKYDVACETKVRKRSEFTPTTEHRILFDNNTYKILSIISDERGVYLTLLIYR